MSACHFCDRSPAPSFAVTRLKGDPKKIDSWCRQVLPLCGRCHKALVEAGLEGRKAGFPVGARYRSVAGLLTCRPDGYASKRTL